MSNHCSTEEIANGSLSGNIEREVSAFQTLFHEAVNKQIRGFLAPLTRQLYELIQLVQEITLQHSNSYPRIKLRPTSGTAMLQSKFHTRA